MGQSQVSIESRPVSHLRLISYLLMRHWHEPDDCTTHHTRARVGEANLALGRHEESARAFKVALKLEPGNKSYTDALARVELDKKASDKVSKASKAASGRKVPNPPGVNQPAPAAPPPHPSPPHSAPSRTAVSAPPSAPSSGSAPPKAPPLGAATNALRISVGAFQTAYEQTVSETDALRAEATSLGTRVATLEARCVLTHTIPAAFTVSIA